MLNRLSGKPVPMVLLGAFMISFSAIWVKVSDVPPTTSAFYRVFFGFVFLLAPWLYSPTRIRHISAMLLPAMACGFTFALDLHFWHLSISYIGPGLATIIGNFQVFLMAACGFLFFNERLLLRFLFAMPLAFFGLFLVIGFHWSALEANYRLGVFYGFLTAFAYTGFLLLLRKMQLRKAQDDHCSPLLLISFFTAFFLGIYMLFGDISFSIPTLKSAAALVSLGLLSQAIGWLLIAASMPKIPASFTGLILLLQPSLSFVWDVLFFARPTTGLQWAGTIITLWAIYLGLTGSRGNS
ncbi:DMT family transporter [Desulfopila sp. IMCC35008]|uniref:DMT family transporter n=1 Tax=Desulfopila sp. IMCC35008 TaxID=2653858 RepID=UPI0013D50135|nr:DMT family transporter [Desulfopila sp. IMCC35008]